MSTNRPEEDEDNRGPRLVAVEEARMRQFVDAMRNIAASHSVEGRPSVAMALNDVADLAEVFLLPRRER